MLNKQIERRKQMVVDFAKPMDIVLKKEYAKVLRFQLLQLEDSLLQGTMSDVGG